MGGLVPIRRLLRAPLLLGAVVLNGCVLVGGPDESRPQPDRTLVSSPAQLVLPTTRPIRDDSGGDIEIVGVTTAPPERILEVSRALLQPTMGSLKYVRRELGNGRIRHRLLSPRYSVSDDGRSFRWLEVSVNYNPITGRSLVEAYEVVWNRHAVLASGHGMMVWFFPPTRADEHKGEDEHQLLVTILQSLDDASAYVTSWGRTSE
jgi:hypothetical protein